MRGSRPVRQPLAGHFRLSKSQAPSSPSNIEYMFKVPYSSAVGCVMYSMICTQPDLAHGISVLSRYMSNPGKEHWLAMKWLLRYIICTTRIGLVYERTRIGVQVEGYVDSDYDGDVDNRRSTSAYFFMVNGNCVSWKS